MIKLLESPFISLFTLLSKYTLVISIIVSTFIFVLFYPTFYGTNDEHCYLRSAWNLPRDGLIYEDYAEGLKSLQYGEHYAPICMLGTSVIMSPFTFIGWEATFAATFIMFLIGIITFHNILKKLDINPFFTYLYVFFPAFVYYSRTLFSEHFTLTTTLLGVYFFINHERNYKKIFLSSLFFSLAIFTRYTQIFVVLPFGLFLLYLLITNIKSEFKNQYIKSIIAFSLPLILFFFLIMFINNYLYNNPFSSGYTFEEGKTFNISLIPLNFIKYFIVLNIIYPFMFFTGLFAKTKYKLLFLLAFFIPLTFYSTFGVYNWEIRVLDLIFGIRYLIPFLPFLMILSFDFLNELIIKFSFLTKITLINIIFLIIFAAFGIHFIHQKEFLEGRTKIKDEISQFIPDDSIIIGEADDFIYLMEPFNDKFYEDVANIETLEDSKSKYINEKDIYLIKIVYPYEGAATKPTNELQKFFELYKDNLERIDDKNSFGWIEIYKLQKPEEQ